MNTIKGLALAGALLCAAALLYAGCITVAGEQPPPVNNDYAFAVTVLGDGSIVAAGRTRHSATPQSDLFALARYRPDGSPETGFGGGKVTTDMWFDEAVFDVVGQSDGKIVAAGHSSFNVGNFTLARYNADGTLDAAFGRGGKVATPMGGGIAAVVLQGDGRIVAAGYSDNGGGSIALVRYLGDGTLDNTFGEGGKVFSAAADTSAYDVDVAVQADGRIVAVWNTGYYAGSVKFTVARFLADGSPDNTFGTGGRVTSSAAYHDALHSVALQPDGKILAAGCCFDPDTSTGWYDLVVRRFNSDGSPDVTFGGGKVLLHERNALSPCTAYGVRIANDGKIVVAGASYDFVLARYNPDGTPDNTFGSGGKASRDPGVSIAVSDIALQPDGRIIIGGGAYRDATGLDFAVKRYNGDGTVDNTFGSGGVVTTAF